MKSILVRNIIFTCLLVANSCLHAMGTDILFDHSWTLSSINSRTIDQTLYTEMKPNITFEAGDKFYAFAGCNRIAGGYTLTPPDQLQFGNTLTTKMACVNAGNIEDEFVAMLGLVRFWQVENNQLLLLDANRRSLATFN